MKKTRFYRGLDKIQTPITETGDFPTFFSIRGLSSTSTFTLGKNSFFIASTDRLHQFSSIDLEVLDSMGNVIYTEFPGYIEDNSVLVNIYVYDDTIGGLCTITLTGYSKDYPKSTQPTVKWQTKVYVDPARESVDSIKFQTYPTASFTIVGQTYYSGSTTNTSSAGHSALAGSDAGGSYYINAASDFFTSDMINGTITANPVSGFLPGAITDGYTYTYPTLYTGTIKSVVNSKTITVLPKYYVDVLPFGGERGVDNFPLPASFTALSGNWNSSYPIFTYITSSTVQPFLHVDLTNIDTYVGKVDKIYAYAKSLNTNEDYNLLTIAKVVPEEFLFVNVTASLSQIDSGYFDSATRYRFWTTQVNPYHISSSNFNQFISFSFSVSPVHSSSIQLSAQGYPTERYFAGGETSPFNTDPWCFDRLGDVNTLGDIINASSSFAQAIFYNASVTNIIPKANITFGDTLMSASASYAMFSNQPTAFRFLESTNSYFLNEGTISSPIYPVVATSLVTASYAQNTEYSITYNIAGYGSVDFYMYGTSFNATDVNEVYFGKKIGTLTNSSLINRQSVSFVFSADKLGSGVLKIVSRSGKWIVSAISIKLNIQTGYSPNKCSFSAPIAALQSDQQYQFKLTFANPVNKTAFIDIESIPLGVSGSTTDFSDQRYHNALLGLQGGVLAERYHLTADQVNLYNTIGTTSNISASSGYFHGDVFITGELTAAVKHFMINHPTQPNKKILYSSVESPYNALQLTGKAKFNSKGISTIELPDYFDYIADYNSIHIQATSKLKDRNIYVTWIDPDLKFFVLKHNHKWFEYLYKIPSLECYWILNADRKDIGKLKVIN